MALHPALVVPAVLLHSGTNLLIAELRAGIVARELLALAIGVALLAATAGNL